MPTTEQILAGLARIANEWRGLAVFWHLFLGALAVALLAGVRPPRGLAAVLLAMPLLSASALAWEDGNLFNGVVLLLTGAALIRLPGRLPPGTVRVGPPWAVGLGGLMVALGWVYPHFLATDSFLPYLYAAPVGLLPCPTLLAVTGLALILRGLDCRPWSLTLGAVGLFYGLFGALRLGVVIDGTLILGAGALIALALGIPRGVAQARSRY